MPKEQGGKPKNSREKIAKSRPRAALSVDSLRLIKETAHRDSAYVAYAPHVDDPRTLRGDQIVIYVGEGSTIDVRQASQAFAKDAGLELIDGGTLLFNNEGKISILSYNTEYPLTRDYQVPVGVDVKQKPVNKRRTDIFADADPNERWNRYEQDATALTHSPKQFGELILANGRVDVLRDNRTRAIEEAVEATATAFNPNLHVDKHLLLANDMAEVVYRRLNYLRTLMNLNHLEAENVETILTQNTVTWNTLIATGEIEQARLGEIFKQNGFGFPLVKNDDITIQPVAPAGWKSKYYSDQAPN